VGYETQTQFINTILSHFDNVPSVQTAGDAGVAVLGNDVRKAGVWAQGFDTYLHEDPRGLSNGYDANVWGTSMGYDVPVMGNFICGLNAGYAWNNIRTKDSGARTTANNYQGSIYGSFSHDAYYVDGILSFAYNQYDSTRHVAVGAIDRTPKSDYGGQQYSAYLETGYTFKNNKVTLTPLGSAQYAHLHVNGYTEDGGGAAGLTVAGQDYDMFQTGLGARLAYKIAGKDHTLIPDIHVKWLYDFIGDNQQATSTFTGGGASFATSGFTPAQSSYDFGTRWIFLSKPNITLSLNYDFEVKEDFYSHAGYANVRYDF
jgi:outer membrane autotransporter protein